MTAHCGRQMARFIATLGCTWPMGCRLDICPVLHSPAAAASRLLITHEAVILMKITRFYRSCCYWLAYFCLKPRGHAFEVMLPGLFPRLIIPYIKFWMRVKWKGGCKSGRRGKVFAVGNHGPSVVLNLSTCLHHLRVSSTNQ